MDTLTRPRSKSTFSFRSNKSDKKNGPSVKMDLTETAEEKKKSRFTGKSKVNPNRALNEPQPVTAQQEASTLTPLGGFQHRDMNGNIIADPDRTNPTRSRFERPLDTIRSFEAAIDSGYKRKTMAARAESADAVPGFNSRRSSMLMGNDTSLYVRNSPASVYGNSRHASFRGNYDQYGPSQFPQRRSAGPRSNLGPIPAQTRMSSDFGIYPIHAYHESHDTVNTTGESSGSNSTEQWGNSTDPSSENSSVDRVQAVKQTDSGDAYAAGPYGRGSPITAAIQEESWHDGRSQHQEGWHAPPPPAMRSVSNGMGLSNGMGPSMPQQYAQARGPAPRNVIKLGSEPEGSFNQAQTTYVPQAPSGYPSKGLTNYAAPSGAQMRQEAGDEKKGWLKRRFSKK